jgi:hypothetical protein
VFLLFSRHNDLPWNIRKFLKNQLVNFRFAEDLREMSPWSRSSWSHTDLPRLREGMVAAQVGVAVVTVSQLCSSSMCRSTARKLIERLLFFILFIFPLFISIPFHYFNRFLLSLSFMYLSSQSFLSSFSPSILF